MSLSLRTTILATGCILAIGTSAARAQMPRVYYYSAPGNYATTQGTVNIPAAGYYYNVPLNAVPAPASPAPAQGSTSSSFYYPPNSSSFNASANRPAQGSTYPYSFSSYPLAPSSGYYGGVDGPGVGPNVLGSETTTGSGPETTTGSAYVSGDEEDNPDW